VSAVDDIRSIKHQIEDDVIRLLKFVSTLRDDDDLNSKEGSYLSNVRKECISILIRLGNF
jgi:hypothetical protein